MTQFMPTTRTLQLFAMFILAATATLAPITSEAQSGSRQKGGTSQLRGSNTGRASSKKTKIALEGYCPVCIINMKKWVRGNGEISSTFDGKTYLFPGKVQKAIFDASPTKFVPVLGGDCSVAFKKMGKRVPGNIRQAAFHKNRLFMFSNEMAKKEFVANKDAYANVDIALSGNCSVCRVEMQKDVAGKSEFASYWNGMWYYFPGEKQRNMFVENPSKYSVTRKPNSKVQNLNGSGSRK